MKKNAKHKSKTIESYVDAESEYGTNTSNTRKNSGKSAKDSQFYNDNEDDTSNNSEKSSKKKGPKRVFRQPAFAADYPN